MRTRTASDPTRKIDLIYIDSGGGHRAAAMALDAVIREQRRPWEVRLRGAQELFDSIDVIRQTTGIPFQEVYNIMLRRGWTIGSAQLIPVMHALIHAFHRNQVRVLVRQWTDDPPDMVVSLIPHYNRAFRQALAQTCPEASLVTVLTDIADYPPHFWIERQEQFLVCGSARAVEQARALGHSERRILRTSGMILDPKFYAPLPVDRAAERRRQGLQPHLPTGLVMFGGQGSLDAVKVVRSLDRARSPVQLIVLCGRHEEAMQELQALEPRIPMRLVGFTSEMPYYMRLADFFIGKPGPGGISEALAMHLPVIVERNFRTLAHERYNADWILEQQVGMVVKSFSEVHRAVARLLEPERYAQYRARAAAVENRAVYEVPEWLDSILSGRIAQAAHQAVGVGD